jgi:pyrroloquinoline quinone biosynthesis protein E
MGKEIAAAGFPDGAEGVSTLPPAFRGAMERWRQNVRFVKRRPALAMRAAVNLLAVRAGRARLRAIDFDVTNVCPLRCAQCYAADVPVQRDAELTVAEFARVAGEARRLGALQANLSGGEALVRRDLADIIGACRRAGLLVSLCTSGVGLTPARLGALASAGLDVIIFSVDSSDAATHDANRGVRGLHARVLRMIGAARSLGVQPVVNTVATPEKVASGELASIHRLVNSRGAMLNLTMPTAIGRWVARDDVLLDDTAREAVTEFLRRPGVRTDTHSAYGATGCPAGTEKLNISADGTVRLCPLIDASWGDVRREPLAAIWRRVRPLATPLRLQEFCPAATRDFTAPRPAPAPPVG